MVQRNNNYNNLISLSLLQENHNKSALHLLQKSIYCSLPSHSQSDNNYLSVNRLHCIVCVVICNSPVISSLPHGVPSACPYPYLYQPNKRHNI